MWISITEYIFFRFIRKFLLPEWFIRKFSCLLPYYQSSQGESSPEQITGYYLQVLTSLRIDPTGMTIIEIGSGASNGTLYELIARGVKKAIAIEPFVPFNRKLDIKQATNISLRFPDISLEKLFQSVQREKRISQIYEGSIDIAVSNSVLEHVKDLPDLFKSLNRVLKPGGIMIHIVDYRDHFFKYPFYFLLFSKSVWKRFLAPPDLFRYRISDHITKIKEANFSVTRMNESKDEKEFNRIRKFIHPSFSGYTHSDLSTTHAVLIGRKPKA